MSNSLFLAPHSDDETLWGSFTLMREKPLVCVVTDSFIQSNRGEAVTADMRWQETLNAMKILGCPLIFGNIRDDIIDEWAVKDLLSRFYNFDTVYAPAVQGGNKDHDLIGRLAKERFKNVIQYSTYAKGEWFTKGTKEIKPSLEELKLKDEALSCYRSQWDLIATRGHFEASLKARSEWYI